MLRPQEKLKSCRSRSLELVKREVGHSDPAIWAGDTNLKLAIGKLSGIEDEPYFGPCQALSTAPIERLSERLFWLNNTPLHDTKSEFSPEVFPTIADLAFAI